MEVTAKGRADLFISDYCAGNKRLQHAIGYSVKCIGTARCISYLYCMKIILPNETGSSCTQSSRVQYKLSF